MKTRKSNDAAFVALAFAMALPVVAQAFIGGEFPGEDFPGAVPWIWGYYRCSGTKISDHFILTAAHCFLNSTDFQSDIENFDFNFGGPKGIFTDPSKYTTKVKKLIVHEQWLERYDLESDLALIEIESGGPRMAVPIATTPLTSNETLIVGGYGCKGPNYPEYPFLTVALKQPLDLKDATLTFGMKDSDGKSSSMGCPGDSGGGVYRINPSTQALEVVAVNHATDISMRAIYASIQLDQTTGKILTLERPALLKTVNLTDPTVSKWLKNHLPAEAFSANR
jgi:hypothetical protein